MLFIILSRHICSSSCSHLYSSIFPYDEYLKRKEEQIKLINEIDKVNCVDIIDCDYDNDYYNECIKGLDKEPERGNRCKVCYYLRMEKTAILAKENDYDFFCTTLSVSPYKNAEWINNYGKYQTIQFCFFISHRTIIYPFIASKAPIILMEFQGFETFADYFLKECT